MIGHLRIADLRHALATTLAIGLLPWVAGLYIDWVRARSLRSFWLRLKSGLPVWTLFPFVYFERFLVGRDLGFRPWLLVPALASFVGSGILWRRLASFEKALGRPKSVPDAEEAGLLTEGIYGRLRHPRYARLALTALGAALIANYLGGYVLVAIAIAALLVLVEIEERELAERFGPAYESYRSRVPRFFPRLR